MTPEGYYNPVTANYYYYLKDHLGNNRVTYHYSGSVPVIDQEVEYYPFGSMFAANNLQNNLYLYNGKELNNEFFENYDFGARFYDAQMGRWHSFDPASELGHRWSPYAYTFDNPMRFIDPDGMWPDDPPDFKRGWNQTIQRYNDNFYSGLQDRIDNPKLLLNDLANVASGLMNLATDVTGISNFVTGENKTAQALSGVISTVVELPKMSAEERGVVGAGLGIAITEMALTRKLPVSKVNVTKTGWSVGESITNLTSKGNVPAWSTVRQRYWKNESFLNNASNIYSESNLLRMRKGLAPQIRNTRTGRLESIELHHTKPQREGGLFEFIKVTPDQHSFIDPYRKIKQ